jgi:hypothetical protein
MLESLRIATPWIGMKLGLLSRERMQSRGKQLFDWLMSHPSTSTAAGWVFEGRGHGVFHQGGEFNCASLTTDQDLQKMYKDFRATRTCSSKASKSKATALQTDLTGVLKFCLEKCPVPTVEIFSNLGQLSTKLRSKPGSQLFNRDLSNVYLRPHYSNLGAIDSLVVTIGDCDQPRAIFFQLTIAERHLKGARVVNRPVRPELGRNGAVFFEAGGGRTEGTAVDGKFPSPAVPGGHRPTSTDDLRVIIHNRYSVIISTFLHYLDCEARSFNICSIRT